MPDKLYSENAKNIDKAAEEINQMGIEGVSAESFDVDTEYVGPTDEQLQSIQDIMNEPEKDFPPKTSRLDELSAIFDIFNFGTEAEASEIPKIGRLDDIQNPKPVEKKTGADYVIVGPTWYGVQWDDQPKKEVKPNEIRIPRDSIIGKLITGYNKWADKTTIGRALTKEENIQNVRDVASLALIGAMGVSGVKMLIDSPVGRQAVNKVTQNPIWSRLFGRNISGQQMMNIFRKTQPGQPKMTRDERKIWDAFQNVSKSIPAKDATKYGVRISPTRGMEVVLPKNVRLPAPGKTSDITFVYAGVPGKPKPGDVQAMAKAGEIAGQALGGQGVAGIVQQAQQAVAKGMSKEEFIVGKSTQLVEEGKPIIVKGFHGTPDARFLEEFDPNKKGYFKDAPDLTPDNKDFIDMYGGIKQGFKGESVTGQKGVFFSNKESVAKSYARDDRAFDYQNAVPMTVERNIILNNPKVIDKKGAKWHATDKEVSEAIKEGYDGIIIKNVRDNYNPSDVQPLADNIVVFNPEQIKTKQQLTDAYNQAKELGTGKPPKPPTKTTFAMPEEPEGWDDDIQEVVQSANLTDEQVKALKEISGEVSTELSSYVSTLNKAITKKIKLTGIGEEEKLIPKKFIAKEGGRTLDDIAQEYSEELGILGFEKTGDGLREFINEYHVKEIDLTGKEQKQLAREAAKRRKQAIRNVAKVDKILGKKVAKSKVKPLVRSTTGQYVDESPTVKESVALKRSLKMQERAANKAKRLGRDEAKETMKLLKSIKAKPIENVSYDARKKMKELKQELNTTRTLEGLRQLNEKINAVKEAGKVSFERTVQLKNLKHQLQTDLLTKTVQTVKEVQKPVTRATTKKQKKSTLKTFRVESLRPTRWLDILDGGANFSGIHNKIFYDSVNKAVDSEFKKVSERQNSLIDFVNKSGNKMEYFTKTKKYGDAEFTKEEMIGVYNSMKNTEKMLAMVYGNNISIPLANQIIADLSDFDKSVGDFIMQNYEDNWERNNKAFIEYTDGKHELGKVENYSPIARLDSSGEPTEKQILDELAQRKGLKKSYVERGFTKSRKNVPAEFQKPIRLDEVSLFMENVNRQEHFISHGNLVKRMQRILNDKNYRDAIVNNPKLGRPYVDALTKYVNVVSNPNIYKSYDAVTKAVTAARTNIATAYLSYNMVTMAKQFPSISLYLGKISPSYLAGAFGELTTDYKNTIEFIHGKSAQMKNRQIEREMEELKNADPKAYNKIISKIGRTGFRGIYLIDQYVTHGGWLGAYNESLRTMGEERAARYADKVVLMSQPAASPKDLAGLYTTNEFLNVFLQFSNQLNQIYNILTYDIPSAASQGRYKDSLYGLLGVGLGSYMIWVMTNGRVPKTKKEIKEAFTESAISSIPVVGPTYVAQKKGFEGGMPTLQVMTEPVKIAVSLTKEYDDWRDQEKAMNKTKQAMIKAIALIKGLPYSQVKRTVSGIKGLYDGDTTDLRRLIWSEYNLKEEDFEIR